MAKGQIKQAQIKIDQVEFEKLCQMQCTREEIIGFFGVDDNTLIDWCKETYGCDFRTIFNQKREGGKCSLRRKQWKVACETENATMLIWLGKQYLGQTEKVEAETTEKIEFVNDINSTTDR